MLRPRLIPCLLVHDQGLVKTTRFKDPKYVGDPINAVRIFNEKEVDELIVVDIDASRESREPDYKMIENLAAECTMPLCYGGGITTTDQVLRIVGLGVEKVAISSAAIANPDLILDAADHVGSQSIVVVLDVKKKMLGRYEVLTHNGQRKTGLCPIEFAQQVEARGAGEILINAIDEDGLMSGYNLDLAEKTRAVITIPLTILGGAGSLADISQLVARQPIVGAAAGSLFVFKGTFRAVLINYPDRAEKDRLFGTLG